MHIPPSHIYREIRSSEGNLWYIPDGDGVAILLKSPTFAIKALLSSSSMSLALGWANGILCLGARIHDIPDHPLLLASVTKRENELSSLNLFLATGTARLFLYSEIDICIAWTEVDISPENSIELKKTLTKADRIEIEPISQLASDTLDSFCAKLELSLHSTNKTDIDISEAPITSRGWNSNRIGFVGFNENHTIKIDDTDEGGIFEKTVWACFEAAFPFGIWKSPEVRIGNGKRELTDILCSYEHGSFLIETKDLSVLGGRQTRSKSRRFQGIKKQIKKAVTQLEGASKAIHRGEKILDLKAAEIDFNRRHPLHCIVLVSDMMNEGDWSDVVQDLVATMRRTKDYFHVFDLSELVTLLKGSSGDPRLLDYNLIKKVELFATSGNIHIRSRLPVTGQSSTEQD